MRRVLRVMTSDGGGEAIQDKRGGIWLIALPSGDYKLWGSKADVRSFVRDIYPDAVVTESDDN